MPKRKFITENNDHDGYADAECPECDAVINAHFQRGRDWRRLQCPVCHRQVTVSIEKQETPLTQLRRATPERS
jgi:ssDNA-binding Zn-finger/Zn-ribbon topoisomerase 1